ncbi:MAG: hypothetical protein JXB39_12570 [Deltaproteobacteria bacterium]|nr:hypothetical protein [Deltaproteobacteria bacterium]
MPAHAILIGLPLVLVGLGPGLAWAEKATPTTDVTLPRFHYVGPGGEGLHTAEEIAAFVVRDRQGSHFVWAPGWPAWKPWSEVPAVARAVPPPAPSLPEAGTSPGTTWLYSGADGHTQALDTDAVSARIEAEPGAVHLVWKPGMRSWTRAEEVPEVRRALERTHPGAVPAPPPEGNPPPLPSAAPSSAPPTAPDPAPGPETTPEVPMGVEPPLEPTGLWEGPLPQDRPGPDTRVGGEVWFGFRGDGSVGTDVEHGSAFATAFQVQHARLRAEARLADRLTSQVGLDLSQPGLDSTVIVNLQRRADDRDVADDTVEDLPSAAWALALEDAWVDLWIGRQDHRVRTGVQEPILGTTDWVDAFDEFFVGGAHAWGSLAWRSGVAPARDLGLAVRIVPAEPWALEAQVLDGPGTSWLDPRRRLLGRVTYAPGEILRVQASGQSGVGSQEQDRPNRFDLAFRARLGPARLMAEGLIGSDASGENAPGFAGFQAAAAWDVPLPHEGLDHLSLVTRFTLFDPVFEPRIEGAWPDAWYAVDAAVHVYWSTTPSRTLLTGLAYEGFTPQNDRLPVGHEAVLQAVWRF